MIGFPPTAVFPHLTFISFFTFISTTYLHHLPLVVEAGRHGPSCMGRPGCRPGCVAGSLGRCFGGRPWRVLQGARSGPGPPEPGASLKRAGPKRLKHLPAPANSTYPRATPAPQNMGGPRQNTKSNSLRPPQYNAAFPRHTTPQNAPFVLSIDLVDGDRRNDGRRMHIEVLTPATVKTHRVMTLAPETRPNLFPPIEIDVLSRMGDGRWAAVGSVMDLGLESCGRLMGCDAR